MDPSIRQRLEEDLKSAMRAGDQTTRDAIRFILAAVKNAEIDARGKSGPADAVATLRKVGNQLADAAEQYRQAGRVDLAEKEEAQLAVLQRYLPAELSDADLATLADETVREVGASGPKEMGKVMPVLIKRVDGRADGRRISAAAKAALEALG
jgi:uncharacterized protein YqeY